uniref:Uncharacterized protein n=1 Tax=Anguilla anguilla TaxID=7936 RepID=A0A0E9PTQ6_ANGAN
MHVQVKFMTSLHMSNLTWSTMQR